MKKKTKLLALMPLLFCLSSCDKQLGAKEAVKFVDAIGEELCKDESFAPTVGTVHSHKTRLEDGLTTTTETVIRFNAEEGSRYFYEKSVIASQSQSESEFYLYEKDEKYYRVDLEGEEKSSKEYTTEKEFAKDFNSALRSNELNSEAINYKARWYLFYISYCFDNKDKEEKLSLKLDQKLVKFNDYSFKFDQTTTYYDSNSEEKNRAEFHVEFKDKFPITLNTVSPMTDTDGKMITLSEDATYAWGKTTYLYPTITI